MPDSPRVFIAGLPDPDRSVLRRRVEAAGWTLVERIEDADVVLSSTAEWTRASSAQDSGTRSHQAREPLIEALTARERDVLTLLADGLSNREIAQRLAISEHTVKFHLGAVFGKLGASTRTDAVTKGLRLGLVEI